MKPVHIALFISCLSAVGIGIGIYIYSKQPKPAPIVQILVYDASASAKNIRDMYLPATRKIFGLSNPDNYVVLCSMKAETEVPREGKGLPSDEELKPVGMYMQTKKPYTNITAAINLVARYVDQHSSQKVMIVVFTDGKHDVWTDYNGQTPRQACEELTKRANIIAFGVFGVDMDIREEWKDNLAPFDNRGIVRGILDTDSGIDEMFAQYYQIVKGGQ